MEDYIDLTKVTPLKEEPIESIELDTPLWRYMDFTKFISLLIERKLYFRRIDGFEDPYEGFINPEILNSVNETIYDAEKKDFVKIDKLTKALPLAAVEGLIEISKLRYQSTILNSFVNCWHINQYESAAMWRLYSKTGEAIAIETTVRSLIKSFDSKLYKDRKLYFRKVEYMDYKKFNPTSEGLGITKYLFKKRKSFEHENEYRIIYSPDNIYELSSNGGSSAKDFKNFIETKISDDKGKYLDIDLSTLIHKVHISPDAEAWFYKTVQETVKRLGFDFEFIKSDLYKIR